MNNKETKIKESVTFGLALIGLFMILIYFITISIKKHEEPKIEIHKPTITADTVRIDTFSEVNLNTIIKTI